MLNLYNYDEFGNISKIENFVNGHSNETSYSYDRNNRLVSRNIDGTTTNYTYDRQGNLVYDGTSVYRYNGFNRLVGINSDHSNISYTYDHTGLRTSKNVNGTFTRLVNDGQNVVAQYVDGKGAHFYREFSRKNNLPHMNPHAFRHTMASMLYFSGVDSVSISNQLGHAQVSTTVSIRNRNTNALNKPSHLILKTNTECSQCDTLGIFMFLNNIRKIRRYYKNKNSLQNIE